MGFLASNMMTMIPNEQRCNLFMPRVSFRQPDGGYSMGPCDGSLFCCSCGDWQGCLVLSPNQDVQYSSLFCAQKFHPTKMWNLSQCKVAIIGNCHNLPRCFELYTHILLLQALSQQARKDRFASLMFRPKSHGLRLFEYLSWNIAQVPPTSEMDGILS